MGGSEMVRACVQMSVCWMTIDKCFISIVFVSSQFPISDFSLSKELSLEHQWHWIKFVSLHLFCILSHCLHWCGRHLQCCNCKVWWCSGWMRGILHSWDKTFNALIWCLSQRINLNEYFEVKASLETKICAQLAGSREFSECEKACYHMMKLRCFNSNHFFDLHYCTSPKHTQWLFPNTINLLLQFHTSLTKKCWVSFWPKNLRTQEWYELYAYILVNLIPFLNLYKVVSMIFIFYIEYDLKPLQYKDHSSPGRLCGMLDGCNFQC